STMSAVTRDYFEWPQTQTGVDRDFGVWWNYPVNDYSHGNLFMEPLDCLDNDVDNICSFFLNPMSEADASKVAIYSGADYSWNISDFKSKESWSRAIDELVPEADEEFERFANNIGYLNQGSGFFFDESTYLKDDIDALNNALSSGKGLDQAVKQLKDRFVQMEQDVQILRTIKNKELLEEITSHLNAYEAIAKAGIAAMDAFNDASNGDIESCMSHLEVLEAKLAESQSYKVTLLGGGTTQAKVCTYRIFPLLDNCSGQIMTILNKNINSTVQERMLSNVDGLKLQDVQYQSSTYSIKDISVTMNKNDYLGIALPKVVNIYQIKVKGTPLDHFKVQYSLNGIEWKDIDAQEKDDTLTTNNIVTAAYARILCTKDRTKAEIDQLSVMPAYDPVSASISTDMTTYQNYIISNAMDGDLSTKYWSSSNVADGNHICVDLGALSTLKTVEIYSGINRLGTVDCFPKTRLEISKDGKTWEQVDSTKDVSEFSKVDGEDSLMKLSFDAKGSQARYFRLICEGNGDVWVMVNEIIYDSEYVDYENHLKVDTNMPIYHTYKKENAFDGNKSTWMWTSRGSQKDDYVKVDLGNLVPLYDASIYFGKNTENASLVIDGFHSTKCQVSTDGETWKDAGTLSFDEYEENGDYYIANFNSDGTLVRYIRFVSLENYDSWVKVYEVTYNQTIEAMKNTSKTVSTNMSKYSDYNIQYALDDDMDTRFYSNSSTKAGDYVQVDFGKIISVYDAAIYFGGSPNSEATAIDGFGKTKVQVSKDGQTWSDVGEAKANTEYTLVNGRYLASFNVGGVSARYLRFTATEACKNWAQIYEMQFNKSVDDNAIRYTSGNVNINHSNYLDDGQLQTSPVIYQVSNGDQLIYPMTTITNVKTIGILQDAQAISNAQVSIQKLDGQWIEIGQLDKLWNKFEINDKILAIRMTFDGQKQPMINEIIVTPMDSDELISYIDELENGDYSSYTEESVKALKDEIEKAKKVANDTNSTQKDINDALESLKKAKDALVLKEA
ncbi:MAG: discoidin domain-containing protein, partial [Faecalibacillus sp.]